MRKLFKDFIDEISKEELFNYYESENHTVTECCEYFNVGQSMLMRILKYYGIKKSVANHTKNIKKTKLEHYGDENYNNEEKRKTTNKIKYGVENQFQRKELFPAIHDKKVTQYGSANNIEKNLQTRIANSGSLEASYKKQYETYKETCQERYGVDNAALLEETKEKIKITVQETFLDKYGVTNYFSLEDAKRSYSSKNSKPNNKFSELLSDAQLEYSQEFYLDGKWYDFKINNTLIEVDPTATHNITWNPFGKQLDKNYHLEKTKLAIKNNYKCIHVFDWDSYEKIIMLLQPRQRIYARNCEIKEISLEESNTFIEQYHIQGTAKDKIRLGLFYNNKLVSVMTFGNPRYNNKYEYELIRYCSASFLVVGGAEKLFKYFINKYKPTSIISYCDLSKFNGNTYLKLGFKLQRKSKPAKHWYNLKTHQHITDNLLRARGYDQLFNTKYGKGTSNELLMLENNFVEVYDCGQATYIYQK